jgi:uncharacterized RDD family membrane protein YckC
MKKMILNQEENENIIYGKFWPRVGASLIDGLVLLPLVVPINIYNETQWKSIPLLVVTLLIFPIYKIVFEYVYGATIGKQALKLKVVGLQYEKPNLTAIILRNIFNVTAVIFSGFILLLVFLQPGFSHVTTIGGYALLAHNSQGQGVDTSINSCIIVIDVFFMRFDSKSRTLHDRIGDTYVIRKTKR